MAGSCTEMTELDGLYLEMGDEKTVSSMPMIDVFCGEREV